MAPTLRSAREPSPATRKSETVSGRITRAKSLPGGLGSDLRGVSPRSIKKFTLGPIKPSTLVICKACKLPVLKTPPPVTPEMNEAARTFLEQQLMSSILQARGRAVNIQSAFRNAAQESVVLDAPFEALVPVPQDLPDRKRHAPYTVDICRMVGTLYGELGRALATSQKSIAAMEALLATERKRLEVPETNEVRIALRQSEDVWWEDEKEKRIEAARPKKRVRRR